MYVSGEFLHISCHFFVFFRASEKTALCLGPSIYFFSLYYQYLFVELVIIKCK